MIEVNAPTDDGFTRLLILIFRLVCLSATKYFIYAMLLLVDVTAQFMEVFDWHWIPELMLKLSVLNYRVILELADIS